MIVIDTNVFSEFMKPHPAPEVATWSARVRPVDVFITAVTRAEISQGIELLPPGSRKDVLRERASRALARLEERTLSFDSLAADHYGQIVARRASLGRPISVLDAQISAIARAHGASIATRDTGGFADTGVDVIGPWRGSRA